MKDTSRIDIVTVDLAKPLQREKYGTLLATGDEYANSFGAKIVRNGEAVDLTGYAVSGSFVRPDGATVTLDGTAEGSIACVDLDAFCYVSDGAFTLAVKIIKEGYTHTVRMVDGYIRRTDTGSYVATDEMIVSLDSMKGLAATMAETNKEAEDLIADLNEVSAEADKAIEEANNVVEKLPYIGENGNWYRWDDEAGVFVDSGSPSRGEQGIQGVQGLPGETGSDGQDGTSVTVQSVSESAVDGGSNVVTFSDGTTVTIKNGKTGKDGTGVTILGSYDNEAALKAAHPTGTAGDSYMVAGDLYVWSASESTWKNVGQIQGPAGADGADGYTPVKNKDYFDGKDGISVTIKSVSTSSDDGGENVITFSDNKTLTVKNGSKGSQGIQGIQGPAGSDGAPGKDGKNAFTAAVDVTVSASEWAGDAAPYTATVACAGVTASSHIIVGVGGAMTEEQYTVLALGMIVCTGQGDGSITLTAFGEKPEIDLTVNVLEVG